MVEMPKRRLYQEIVFSGDEKVEEFQGAKRFVLCNSLKISCCKQYKLKRSHPLSMPLQEEQETLQFILTLVSVKMKVKFPCKMTLEYNSSSTKQAPPSEDNRFHFNQQIRLKQESRKLFSEISVSLITEKGAKYISGIAKFYHDELVRSEGQRLVVSLAKCLDSEAFCEMRVERVIRERVPSKRVQAQAEKPSRQPVRYQQDNQLASHDFKSPRRSQLQVGLPETKSQSHLPVNGLKFRKQEEMGLGRLPHVSPKVGRGMRSSSKGKGFQFGVEMEKDREKLIEAEVYKENYQKLKQKYMRQAENSKNQLTRRIALQNNQNNYKLEIVRLKLKSEELEKILAEKNLKIKQLSINLGVYQQRQTDLNYMREQLSSRQHTIRMLEESIISLSRQKDEVRIVHKETSYKMEDKILFLQNQIETLTMKTNSKLSQYEREIRSHVEIIQQRDQQLSRRNEQLQKEKKNVYELQKNLQNKLNQFDSLLQNQRNSHKQRIQEIKSRLDEANYTISKLGHQKADLSGEIDKLRASILKNQYEFKLYVQECSNLRNELDDYKSLKEKHGDLSKQLKVISDQKANLEKNYEKIMASKQANFGDLASEYKKQVEYYKRTHKQLDQKSKNVSTKLIETQGQLEIARSSLQKIKKSQQNLTKDFTELKEKEKALKKSLKVKEEEFQDSKNQYNRYKEKIHAVVEVLKGQTSRVKQQNSKLKIELQSQVMKNEQLSQINTEASMQLARLKMSQQFGQERYEKVILSAQQKYGQFERIIKEKQSVIDLLQQKMKVQKSSQKEYYGKIQKTDYELNVIVDKNQKLLKELRGLDERKNILEANLRAKNNELSELTRKLSEIEGKIQISEQYNMNLRDQLQVSKNQLEKSRKIIDILQKDYEKAKSDIVVYIQQLGEKDKALDDQLLHSRKQKESFSTLDARYNNLKKQYQEFKESVGQALNTSFTQVLQSFSQGPPQNKTSSFTSVDYSNFGNKRSITDLGNDLLGAITVAGSQNKSQLIRLSERNKSLERELQILKGEVSRAQENTRRAGFQKSTQIEELQNEIQGLQNEKGELEMHYQSEIHELEEQLRRREQEFSQSQSARNQLQFSLSSLKMQLQSSLEDYDKRVVQLRREKKESEQKADYHYNTIEKLQKKVYQAEVELMNVHSVLMVEKEQSYKKEVKLEQSIQQLQKIGRELESIKKALKQLQERNGQLEVQLSTTRELKQKYENMLNEQEGKLKDLCNFNNNILKEKEEIIKKELQHHEQVTQLQNLIAQLGREKQEAQQWKSKLKGQLQQTKQLGRKYSSHTRQLQNCLSQEKLRYSEIRDHLRQKEQQLVQVREQAANLRKRLQQSSAKLKMNMQELGEQNNSLSQRFQALSSQSAETIHRLQIQVERLTQQLQSSREEVGELEQAIFVQKQNNQSMLYSLTKARGESEDYKKKLQQMQHGYEQLSQQNRQKDQQMFEMGGRLYEYEGRLKELEQQKSREIEQLGKNLNVKYDQDLLKKIIKHLRKFKQ